MLKWLPWKFVVRRVARARGFVDPISVLARLHQFAQPSEVAVPVELLRAGVVFHARGLMNAGSIQHNMDWIWPYWVERQFDPNDPAFLPRAFSITHVNLTHRNWTAVGLPNCEHLPIVDPRGLLTPYWDGWSLDGWIFQKNDKRLVPARNRAVEQRLDISDGLTVVTESHSGTANLQSKVEVVDDPTSGPNTIQHWQAECNEPAWFVLSVRPYNPEGVSFVHDIEFDTDACGWKIGSHGIARFSKPADRHFTSDYKHGDVSGLLSNGQSNAVHCDVGMATAAACFEISPGVPFVLSVDIPLDAHRHEHWLHGKLSSNKRNRDTALEKSRPNHQAAAAQWSDEIQDTATLTVPDDRISFLYDAAVRTLILHAPGEVYPGPYTYKRFWVRDAAFILNAALAIGLHKRVSACLPNLFRRQNQQGYFHSQDGEWDSNGQALWLMERYWKLTDYKLPSQWKSRIVRAAEWISRKRVPPGTSSVCAGLLPAGFSAEHLGPNDFYLWDDFWAIAGLQSASRMLRELGDENGESRYRHIADEMAQAVDRCMGKTDYLRDDLAYPAAPERRMDAGAIGSLAASYPLQLVPAGHERMQGTINFLMDHCMFENGFFQDMMHSGINPYLTLHISQALLREGDRRYFELLNTVAKLASRTGQWPEAIHPRTLGGCMGDGQHVWAAAEFLMMLRNMLVREEGARLIIGSGIPPHWHFSDQDIAFGPTSTPWGKLSIQLKLSADKAELSWNADWYDRPPNVELRVPTYRPCEIDMSSPTGNATVPSDHLKSPTTSRTTS